MKKKGNSITLSYESVYCKIAMDSCRLPLCYGKELVFSPGIARNHTILACSLSQYGVSSYEIDYCPGTDIILFSDRILSDLKTQKRAPFIDRLEKDINSDGSTYKKLFFCSEPILYQRLKAMAERDRTAAAERVKSLCKKCPKCIKGNADKQEKKDSWGCVGDGCEEVEKWKTVAKHAQEELDALKDYKKSGRAWEEKPDVYRHREKDEPLPDLSTLSYEDDAFRLTPISQPSNEPLELTPNPDLNFVAIDFETAKHRMPCQIGIVVVRQGIIVERICELIKPPGNEYGIFEKRIHGITPQKTESSPSFPAVWNKVKHLFDGQTVVAHNAAFDRSVLNKSLEYYHLSSPGIEWECTYQLTDFKLKVACEVYNIPLIGHHDALTDAEACAWLYITLNDPNFVRRAYTPRIHPIEELFQKADPNLITVEELAGKRVLITGETAIDREYLYHILERLGATRRTSVSRLLSIIITGNKPGWHKMEQVEEINANGAHIQTWAEEELYEVLQNIVDKYGFANERPAGAPQIGSLF
jgi:DNA polymerase-3 subunit epsilon